MTMHSLSLTHIVLPPRQPAAGKPPGLFLLHGVGSNEQDLLGLAPSLDPRFFVISVRAPVPLGPSAFGWYRVQFTEQGPSHQQEEAEAGYAAALRFIHEAVELYGLDQSRIYLMGFSQGAITSLSLALREPEMFAGAVIMSGRLLPETIVHAASPERLASLPIFVAHGIQDSVLPIAFGREIQKELTFLPVVLIYREYAMAHQVSSESLNDISHWLTTELEER